MGGEALIVRLRIYQVGATSVTLHPRAPHARVQRFGAFRRETLVYVAIVLIFWSFFTHLAPKPGIPRVAAVRRLRMDNRDRASASGRHQELLGKRPPYLAGTLGVSSQLIAELGVSLPAGLETASTSTWYSFAVSMDSVLLLL